jgi:choice-of-anchor A domain-containing protein
MSGGSSNGKIAYGTTVSIGGAGAPCGTWKAKPVDFPAVEAKLKEYSAAFKAYPANGTVVANGGLTFTGTNATLNVFNVTAAQLGSASQLKFSAPDKSSIIVNVSGTTVLWAGAGFILPDGGASCRGGTSAWCHRILYNMYEATTLQLSGIGVQGSILAPFATMDGGGGNVDGQLIVEYLKGGIEYHPYFFTGCLIFPKV